MLEFVFLVVLSVYPEQRPNNSSWRLVPLESRSRRPHKAGVFPSPNLYPFQISILPSGLCKGLYEDCEQSWRETATLPGGPFSGYTLSQTAIYSYPCSWILVLSVLIQLTAQPLSPNFSSARYKKIQLTLSKAFSVSGLIKAALIFLF